MTQYEYIEQLDVYLRKTYNVSLELRKAKEWAYGYRLIFNYGTKTQSSTAYNAEAEDWKEKLFDHLKYYLRRNKYIE